LANSNGTATISVTVNDGGASNNLVTRNFTVTVNAVNDPPTIGAISNQAVLEDTPAGPINLTVDDVDSPLGSLILSASSSNPALAPAANIVFDGTSANPNMTITPVANQSGTATITVKVSDGQASTS